MSKIALILKTVGSTVSKHSPAILTAVGVAGVVSTSVLAAKGAVQAADILAKAEVDIAIGKGGDISEIALDLRQKAELTWKCYIPALSVGALTIACIVSANSIHVKRNAALASVYSLTETAFKEYQEKVAEQIGKNKEQRVRDSIAEDRIRENPVTNNEVFVTGKGEVRCFDPISARYFKSDIETIRQHVNDINQQCINDMSATQNEFYNMLGLQEVKLGDELGWNTDHFLDVRYTSVLAEDGEPCLSLDYMVYPINESMYYR